MTGALLEWRQYQYFPYERDFAHLEVTSLFGVAGREEQLGLRVPRSAFTAESAERLTYFARATTSRGFAVVPRQATLERSATAADTERQSTRYSAHGLHEYKGKFNPQIVRAIGNILKLDPSATTVLDPFCGSGTTLLECAHIGWNALGVDRNPLAVKIANAKVHALQRAGGPLERLASRVVEVLAPLAHELSSDKAVPATRVRALLGTSWEKDVWGLEYASAWFPPSVLAQVVAVRRALVEVVSSAPDRAVFEVLLSDQFRDASLQEPLDLRIRRRSDPQQNYPLIGPFIDAVKERLPRVTRARAALGRIRVRQRAHLADMRTTLPLTLPGAPKDGFDAVITSPPYATALPYIDTQRLSLILLGLLDPREVAPTEKALIGAREIARREREKIETCIREGTKELPQGIIALCRDMLRAAARPGNGFRRQNVPALLFRYLVDMAASFRSIKSAMKPGAPVALVVGLNRTTLGGHEFVIDTPALLIDIAKHCGYRFLRWERMDTYPRYDMHLRNAINAETLIVLSA